MEKNKKLLMVLAAILIFLNIITITGQKSMKREMQNQINGLYQQLSSLNSQLSSQTNQINQALNKFHEDQKWVEGSNYKLLSYDENTGTIKAQVNWSFRELTPSSKVTLAIGEMAQDRSVQTWKSVKADVVDNLNYTAEINISPERNYKLRVQGESSSLSRGEELMDIDLQNMMKGRMSILPGIHGQMGPRYENHAYVTNRFDGADFLKIKSAVAKVYVRDQLENTIELHRASSAELTTEIAKKFGIEPGSESVYEIWLNDEAIWVKGEENWVRSGENSWTNSSGGKLPGFNEVRIEVTVVDNMGVTHQVNYPPSENYGK